MAKMTYELPEDFQRQIEKLSGPELDKIAARCIDAATPILADSVKKRVAGHRDSGDLVRSVATKKAKKKEDGRWAGYVVFKGKSKHERKGQPNEETNAAKAFRLENGTSDQQPTPFVTSAMNDAEKEVNGRMQYEFNKAVDEL